MTTVDRRLSGVPAAPGVAVGPWVSLQVATQPTPGETAPDGVPAELERLGAGIETAVRDLQALAEEVRAAGHYDEAAIFVAHAEIARDPALVEAAHEQMTQYGVDSIGAILTVSHSIAASLAELGDDVLAARATDVLDVGERIARAVAGVTGTVTLDHPGIIVADDLTPSATAMLPRDRIRGIILGGASPSAHAAILARAYGVPAIVGAADAIRSIRATAPNTTVAIDGGSGEIVLDPGARVRARFARLAAIDDADRERDRRAAVEPATTLDGISVTLRANIGGLDDAAIAAGLGARGVGLFRTEFLFLDRHAPPSEDEQVEAYRGAIERFSGDPVTVRLLDVGGDKPIPYLPIPREDNPFLGVRALRLVGRFRDIFVTQLRACYRAAAAGPVKVMAPMIVDRGDVEAFLRLAAEARDGLTAGTPSGQVELGVMLEIPSALLTVASFLDQVSFVSVGTNDLLQYTLAVDRGNPELERYRDPLHPAVLNLIRTAVRAGDRAGVEVSVCGEMAGDPTGALALVGLGIRSLSMAPASIPAVRRSIRSAAHDDLRQRAERSLDAATAADARSRFLTVHQDD